MSISCNLIKRQFSTSLSLRNVFNHVTVIGGGLMGSGIAQVTAQSGMDVTVVVLDEESGRKSNANIKSSVQKVAKKLFQNSSKDAEKYLSEMLGRLKVTTNLNEALEKTDLVVEAIVENLPAKRSLFSRIDSIAPEHTIFASNTSSIPISEIASVTLRKDRFGGLHFFNPVPIMKLLEIVRTEETSEDTYQKLINWGKAIGKTCITCKDTPGFVVNRLLVPYLAEAIRMLERDVATPRDIDVAMKLGAGYPMGPLELLDFVGLDTTKFILDGWHEKYPDNPLFKPIPLLEKLVSEGKLGKKTGEGFYSYKKNTGTLNIPVHSPYFQRFAYQMPNPLSQILPSEKPKQQSRFVVPKRVRFIRKSEIENLEEPKKEEKTEKLKKPERYGLLAKWRNSEEFLSERDKQVHRKLRTKRIFRQAESYLGARAAKSAKKYNRTEEWTSAVREAQNA